MAFALSSARFRLINTTTRRESVIRVIDKKWRNKISNVTGDRTDSVQSLKMYDMSTFDTEAGGSDRCAACEAYGENESTSDGDNRPS